MEDEDEVDVVTSILTAVGAVRAPRLQDFWEESRKAAGRALVIMPQAAHETIASIEVIESDEELDQLVNKARKSRMTIRKQRTSQCYAAGLCSFGSR